ncbi:hypothetical protein V8G54_014234 [Vigna mungo]|uniref:Uncharacterized protein n=1 Tax=Vigna mungo TaxID=3915 RepID=A0AAQ3NGA9_VIGMU
MLTALNVNFCGNMSTHLRHSCTHFRHNLRSKGHCEGAVHGFAGAFVGRATALHAGLPSRPFFFAEPAPTLRSYRSRRLNRSSSQRPGPTRLSAPSLPLSRASHRRPSQGRRSSSPAKNTIADHHLRPLSCRPCFHRTSYHNDHQSRLEILPPSTKPATDVLAGIAALTDATTPLSFLSTQGFPFFYLRYQKSTPAPFEFVLIRNWGFNQKVRLSMDWYSRRIDIVEVILERKGGGGSRNDGGEEGKGCGNWVKEFGVMEEGESVSVVDLSSEGCRILGRVVGGGDKLSVVSDGCSESVDSENHLEASAQHPNFCFLALGTKATRIKRPGALTKALNAILDFDTLFA